MVDMYRRLNFFPRWIMATSLGHPNRYVPSSILYPISTTTLLTPTYRIQDTGATLTHSGPRSTQFLDARR